MTATMRVGTTRGGVDLTIELFVSDCAQCGVVFGVPAVLEKNRRQDGETFFCPNGHSLTFGQGTNDKLQRERDKLQRERDEAVRDREWFKTAEHEERDRRQSAERSAAAYKGQTTKLRKRAITGTCAFCSRHFANVERHVATVHPGETSEPRS